MVSKEWLSNHFCIYLYLFKYELAFKVGGIRFKIYICIYIWDRRLVQVWSMDLCVGDLKENIIHLFIWLFSFLWCVCRCACLCVCIHTSVITKWQKRRSTGSPANVIALWGINGLRRGQILVSPEMKETRAELRGSWMKKAKARCRIHLWRNTYQADSVFWVNKGHRLTSPVPENNDTKPKDQISPLQTNKRG